MTIEWKQHEKIQAHVELYLKLFFGSATRSTPGSALLEAYVRSDPAIKSQVSQLYSLGSWSETTEEIFQLLQPQLP